MKSLVFIVFSEALSASEAAWSLVDAGFSVLVFARKGRHSALHHSAHVELIEITSPELNTETALADEALPTGELLKQVKSLNPRFWNVSNYGVAGPWR
jgi:hypothetical protein